MNEIVIESINASPRHALIVCRYALGPFQVRYLEYADIVFVRRYPNMDRARQDAWKWVNRGEIAERLA